MMCCKKCEYKKRGCCELLNYVNIEAINYTPCSVPTKYLNEAEVYMRNTNRTMFIEYMNKLLDIQLHIGDELAFINNQNIYGYWHMTTNRPAKQLKVHRIEVNGDYFTFDPTYSACEEEFTQWYFTNPYTMLDSSDFEDVATDFFNIPQEWYNKVTPIKERPERNISKFVSQREKILQKGGCV